MKKPKFTMLTAGTIILCLSLLFAGCSSSNNADSTSTTDNTPETGETSTTTPSTSDEPEATESSGDELNDVINLATDIESVSFDMEVTSPGAGAMTTRIWLKGLKMKTETSAEGQTIINLIDQAAGTMYTYIPAQNTAFMVTYTQPQESPMESIQGIEQYQPTIVGTETIDGKVCLVAEYTVQGMSTKMWIWQEYGFPIRVVTVTDQGTTTINYTNISFDNIPDSEFELPAGVQIMDMGSQS